MADTQAYYYWSDEHKERFDELLSKFPASLNDKYWRNIFYLVSHPDLKSFIKDEDLEKDPLAKLEANGSFLGSGLYGLVMLGKHLFTGGLSPFVLDDYLYKWDGDNFEVALQMMRIARGR